MIDVHIFRDFISQAAVSKLQVDIENRGTPN